MQSSHCSSGHCRPHSRGLRDRAMYEYVHTVYDRRYDNGGFNTLVIVYNYKRLKYEALVVSDEKVGDKEIQIL